MTQPTDQQHLVIVSGLSGAGKSTALKALEDMGYHCIDNLPPPLLPEFSRHIRSDPARYCKVALGMDARAPGLDGSELPGWVQSLRDAGLNARLLFLNATDDRLLQRFGQTRRRHPLALDQGALLSSIHRERELLEELRAASDWEIDTSEMNVHQLTHQTWLRAAPDSNGMVLVLQSFGFSQGVPADADFVFDARSLPNPHWNDTLRPLTGRDQPVAEWLEDQSEVVVLGDDILGFLEKWLPRFENSHRNLVTIGIGCTGGRHRSVYLVERLSGALRQRYPDVMVHHRELKL